MDSVLIFPIESLLESCSKNEPKNKPCEFTLQEYAVQAKIIH